MGFNYKYTPLLRQIINCKPSIIEGLDYDKRDILLSNKCVIYNGDCIDVLKTIPDKSVDLICTDIPYGTTACKWDNIIDFEQMWEQLNRVVKSDESPILLFSQQPFTSELIHSNISNFKYIWYYKKLIASNFASAKYQPMKHIEEICVFTKRGKTPKYYPIMQERAESGKNRINAGYKYNSETPNETMGTLRRNVTEQEYNPDLKFPENVQVFNNREKGARGLHPTQKPLSLMNYLIQTHSDKGDLVLDFTMGSGTTGESCALLNRRFVGIELDPKYYNIAKERIIKAYETNA